MGTAPADLAAGDDEIWVTNAGDGTVSRIDVETNEATQVLEAGSRPTGIAFGDGSLWVADRTGAALLRIDPSADEPPDAIDLPGEPIDVAWTDDGVWVSYSPDGVARIEPSSGVVTHTQTVGTEPTSILSAHGSIWVTNHLDGTISRLEPSSGDVVGVIPVGDGPNALAADEDTVWVTNEYDGTLVAIDVATNTIERTVPLGATAAYVATDDGGVWIAVGASAREHRGGTLRIRASRISSVDPAFSYDTGIWQILTITNDGLLGYKRVGGPEGTSLVPDLAASFPEVSPDGLSYRFTHREGLHYSTGDPVRPEDFRHGLERAIGLNPRQAGEIYSAISGAAACAEAGARCDLSGGIIVEDDAVTIVLERPDPDLSFKLAMPFAYLVPSSVPMENQRRRPVPATGPYVVTRFDETGIELARNERFEPWSGAAQPDGFVDAISWTFEDDGEAAFDALVAGEIDWTSEASPRDVDELLASSPDQVVSASNGGILSAGFDTLKPPFDDRRVRQAVNYALDRAELVDLFGGPARQLVTCQLVPPSIPGYRPYCPYTADPEGGRWSAPDLDRARDLIAAAGVTGERVSVYTLSEGAPSGAVEAMEHVTEVLNELGMRARLEVLDDPRRYFDGLLYGLEPGSPEHPAIFADGWFPDFPTASNYVEPQFGCEQFANAFGVCDPELERLIARART